LANPLKTIVYYRTTFHGPSSCSTQWNGTVLEILFFIDAAVYDRSGFHPENHPCQPTNLMVQPKKRLNGSWQIALKQWS
jgi:hypothetical protein